MLTGRQSQRQGDVGLARAAVAERNDVLASGDVLAARQLQDQGFVIYFRRVLLL